MSWFAWIFFGALAGWLASIVVRDQRPHGCLTNMVTGIVGAVLAGFVYQLSTGNSWTFRWDFASFGMAILGAVVLILVINLVARRR